MYVNYFILIVPQNEKDSYLLMYQLRIIIYVINSPLNLKSFTFDSQTYVNYFTLIALKNDTFCKKTLVV